MYDPIIEQDINNAYFNLIFFFIIIFILIFFLYISFVYSTKPEDNLSISSAVTLSNRPCLISRTR